MNFVVINIMPQVLSIELNLYQMFGMFGTGIVPLMKPTYSNHSVTFQPLFMSKHAAIPRGSVAMKPCNMVSGV